MSTKIEYQTWSGGSGIGDKKILIGYCKESPVEVLRYVKDNYYIYHYKSIYRPVDDNYPNNVMGLVISEAKDLNINGTNVTVNSSIKDLDLSIAYDRSLCRTISTYKEAIDTAIRWHLDELTRKNNPEYYYNCLEAINEIKSMLDIK